MSSESKKQILKSSSVIGGASFITILIGLVKVKTLALLLGPAGIGLMGILATIMSIGSTFFGMGLGTSGVRELALSNKSTKKLVLVRKALFTANFFLGLLAILIVFIFRDILSICLFQSADYQLAICIVAVGVFFSLISASQTALLQGLRKITELAKVKVIGALVSTLIGLLLIWKLGENGIPFFVITLPLATCFIALFYNRKIPEVTATTISFKELKPQWQRMFTIGFAFMLTGLMTVVCQLIVRYIINQELNIESVGYFQASWAISMTYISFVLGAMAADYYPRLTQLISSNHEANRLVNEQTEIAITFSAPVLLAMLAFAPLVIYLLYSSEFTYSIEILRWQVLGDALKVISWPLGFILLAKGHSKLFFCTELLWNTCYVLLVFVGINYFGIEITGYAFSLSYVLYIIVVYLAASHATNFKWTAKNLKSIALLILASSILLAISYISLIATMTLGVIFVLLSFIFVLKVISELDIKKPTFVKIVSLFNKKAKTR